MPKNPLIAKALVDVSEENPVEFYKKMETVFQDKLKTGIKTKVSEIKQKLFSKEDK